MSRWLRERLPLVDGCGSLLSRLLIDGLGCQT
jgi:hypothetical protein